MFLHFLEAFLHPVFHNSGMSGFSVFLHASPIDFNTTGTTVQPQRLSDIMTLLLLLLPSLLGSLVSGSVDKDLDHRGVQQSLSLFNWQRTTFTVISDREV